jgi:anti-anti-sigma factor
MNIAPLRKTSACTAGLRPPRPDYTIVELWGEIDIATSPALLRRLDDALSTAAHEQRRLIIDLTGVSFCDASGLGILIRVQRRARDLNVAMCLAGPRPHVMKLLRITRLNRSLSVHHTLSDAIETRPAA